MGNKKRIMLERIRQGKELYISVQESERMELIAFLISNGLSCSLTGWNSYEETVRSVLPLTVDLKHKRFGHMPQVMTAACAASSDILISKRQFMDLFDAENEG